MALASSSMMSSLPSSYINLHFQLNQQKGLISISKRRRNNYCRLITSCSSFANNNPLLQAAMHAVDTYIRSDMVIGLGSGHASRLAIQYLGQQLRAGKIKDIIGIPTSVGSASEAAKAGILLDQYKDSSQIDFAFNDADIIEENTLAAVIGRQSEESLIQEKAILTAAGELVFIIMGKQLRNDLDGSIPVLINPLNWMETAEEIEELFLGDAEVWRRPSIGHADPLGGDFPLITREGHNVLDLIFTSPILNLADVAESLNNVNGVVEHGVFTRNPCKVVIATEDGVRIVDNTVKSEVCGPQ